MREALAGQPEGWPLIDWLQVRPRSAACLLVLSPWTDLGRSTPWRPPVGSAGGGGGRTASRWAEQGPERSLVATVFSYGLNGYTSVRARKQAQEQEKMPDPTVVGIDISKTHLDTYMAPAGKAARFTNDSAGFKALIAWIDQPVRSVVYEPTGPWHRAFEEALLQAGLPLARANPLQARRFAQAMGQRAKTDAVDARVLAQMGTALPLRPTEASPPTHRALEELQVARDALVTDRTAARNRQKHLRHRLLKQQNKTRLSQIDRHLAAVDAAIGKRLAEDVGLARRTEILTSIPGVSSITAAGLLTRMPELGRLDAKAVASLAGLAPVTRQSGAWQGRSFIQGGRPRVRRLLYMPALAAARCNPDLRAKYRQLRGQGKPPKVALTAVMRKLLLLANALLEQNRSWLPDRPRRGSAAAPAGSAPPIAA